MLVVVVVVVVVLDVLVTAGYERVSAIEVNGRWSRPFIDINQLDDMVSEAVAFSDYNEGKMDDLDLARLSKKLKKFVMMRKVGVPQGAVLQQLSLRRDISQDAVREFVEWCEARGGNISKEDVLAVFPAAVGAYPGSRRPRSSLLLMKS